MPPAVIMWLGEQITISGIGNGISIILFAGIVSRFPTLIKQLFQYLDTGRLVYKILVPGSERIDEAKITGSTPLILTLIGI